MKSLVASCLLFAATSVHGLDLERIDLMPGSKVSWIAQDMQLNGVPVSIRQVDTSAPLNEVVTYYRKAWDSQHPLIQRHEGDETVLAAMQGKRFVSLRLRTEGTATRGLLTVSADPASHHEDLATTLPVPHGAVVVSRQQYRDGQHPAEALTLRADTPVAFNKAEIEGALEVDGWRKDVDTSSTSIADGAVLLFRRGDESMRVIIGSDPSWNNETLILMVKQ